MNGPLSIAVLVGSLRDGSHTRYLVLALANLAPPSMRFEFLDIGGLPLYNPDDDSDPPLPWQTFRARIQAADAVLFATPEYNRSIPGALKNAIDVGSRPYGESVWSGKPAAVLSASPGALGGFGANHHLRQCLVFLDMPTLQQPEAYVGRADRLLDPEGNFAEPGTRDFMQQFLAAFESWITRQLSTGSSREFHQKRQQEFTMPGLLMEDLT
ncbi:MAG TPA: NAD(P)H-dependent oxidoreductase [Burkholderiales bacterium]|nr:NAD(P)H-dependent oxidoreductase [Burkholderiales bacterium]